MTEKTEVSSPFGSRAAAPASTSGGSASLSFWLAPTDPRPQAALRIGLSIVLLYQLLLDFWPYAGALYSDRGVSAVQTLGPGSLGVFYWLSSPASVHTVLAIYALSLVFLGLGLFTRVATFVAWLIVVSMHHRMGGVSTGGDWLVQLFLFLSLFGDLSAVWSLDARLRGCARLTVEPYLLRAFQVLLALLYWSTARLKQRGTWANGEGIRLSLEMVGFARPLGAWLHAHPELCQLMTFFTLGLEYLFPLLALFPIRTRTAQLGAALVGLMIQLGILSTMRVGAFTWIMLVTTVLFIPGDVWDRLGLRMPSAASPASADASAGSRPSSARWRSGLTLLGPAIIGLITLVNAHGILLGSRIKAPEWTNTVTTALGLQLNPGLFHVLYEVSWYEVLVTLPTGEQVDVAAKYLPGLAEGTVGWSFDPWTKAAFGLHRDPRPGVARFFCNHAEDRLQSLPTHLRIVRHYYTQSMSRPTPPLETAVLWDGSCPEAVALQAAGTTTTP